MIRSDARKRAETPDAPTDRDALAEALYARGEHVTAWLTTADGSPNVGSYDFADRVLKSDWLAAREAKAAAKALRGAADVLDFPLRKEWNVVNFLHIEADRIEREGGASS